VAINLSSDVPTSLSVPASVTVPTGASSATVSSVVGLVTAPRVTVTASLGLQAVSAQVSLRRTLSSEVRARKAGDLTADAFCSPGSLASLFGVGFTSQQPTIAKSLPLPTKLAGVQLRINDIPVPLLFVSDTQVNFQCPMLPVNTNIHMAVESEAQLVSQPVKSVVFPATPSVFTIDSQADGQGAIVISATGELAMPRTQGVPSRPAKRGEFISIYSTGLGATRDPIGAGTPAPLDKLLWLQNNAFVVLDGVKLEPQFAGLTPGMVGLYQVNVQIPQDAPAGALIPIEVGILLPDGQTVMSNRVTIAIEE
jgi:uncharacterized protein (TIGR03437 family)